MNTNDRSIVGLVMVSHALVHTYELSIPILMVVWLTEFSTTQAVLGLIVTIGYGLFGIGALPSGIVTDLFGSQRLIAACLLGMSLSFVVLSFATSLLFVAVAIGLWGAAASIYHPAGLSLISTGVEDSGTGFAYHGMAGNAGIAFGPLVAAVLLWSTSWRVVTLVLAVPALVAVGYILKTDIDEMAAANPAGGNSASATEATSISGVINRSRALFLGAFLLVFVIIVFNGLYYRGILTFLPELLSDFLRGGLDPSLDAAAGANYEASDLVYVGLLMVGILGQFVGGKATERIEVEYGLLVGYVVLAIIALLFIPAAEGGVVTLVIVSLLLGFFLFMLQPMYQVAVAKYSPTEARGLSYGFTYLAQFGVGALGAAIVGYMLTYATTGRMFLVIGGFGVIAALVSGYLLWRSGEYSRPA